MEPKVPRVEFNIIKVIVYLGGSFFCVVPLYLSLFRTEQQPNYGGQIIP